MEVTMDPEDHIRHGILVGMLFIKDGVAKIVVPDETDPALLADAVKSLGLDISTYQFFAEPRPPRD